MQKFLVAFIILFPSFSYATAVNDIIVEDPIAQTGTYTLVPDGAFELSVSDSPWLGLANDRGNFTISPNGFFSGAAALANPSLTSPAQGYASLQQIDGLTVGETYVASGYFNIEELDAGSLYINLERLDTSPLGGNNFPAVVAFGHFKETPVTADGWFFAYEEFEASVSNLTIRIVHDGFDNSRMTGGLIDNVAVTPLAQFNAPTSVPEPCSLCGITLISLLAVIRRKRTHLR